MFAKLLHIVILMGLIVGFVIPAQADLIILKEGKELDCIIKGENKDEVRISMDDATLCIPRFRIKEMRKDPRPLYQPMQQNYQQPAGQMQPMQPIQPAQSQQNPGLVDLPPLDTQQTAALPLQPLPQPGQSAPAVPAQAGSINMSSQQQSLSPFDTTSAFT